jgi:septal ring factor EnvC (AmiA/AmiB activator)
MDMSPVDYGTIFAFISLIFKMQSDKAQAGETLGQMKQQIKSLEARASHVDAKLSEIDEKLSQLVDSTARLETSIQILVARENGINLLEPIARRG